jgi:hypothetical protein
VTAAPDSTEKFAADPKLTDVEYTPSALAGEGTDSNPMASNTVANPAKVLFIKDPRNWRLGGRKQGTVGLCDGDVAAWLRGNPTDVEVLQRAPLGAQLA